MQDIARGARIRRARKAVRLTATALGVRVGGAKPHTVWRWEAGQLCPRPATLFALAKELDVDPQWILDGTGRGPKESTADEAA